jgi:RNA recognition motif-containing protein
LNYTKHHRERSPLRYGVPAERRARYNPDIEYHHYGHDEYPVRPPNRGEKDGAKDDSPNVWLLVRGLKETTTEHLFAKGMEKFYSGFENSHTGATPKSIRRVLAIRDRRTDKRMGFGFVQYHTINDAMAAIVRAREMQKNGETLTISSKEFNIQYAHLGVFPHWDFGRQERNTKYLFHGHEKMHKYHDDRYYPDELVVNEESPHEQQSEFKDASDSEKKSRKAGIDTLESKWKKRKAPGAAPAYLDYFQKKQAELREEEANAAPQVSRSLKQPATGVNTISTTDTAMPVAPPDTEATQEQQTFAHEGEERVACYLCNSAFNSRDGVIRHIKESAMHAKYLLDPDLIDRAYRRMEAKKVDPATTIRLSAEEKAVKQVQEATQAQYRDRAAERRQEEAKAGGVQKVGFSLKGKGSKPAGGASTGRNSDSETEKGPAPPSYGKGMGMLEKAGWTAGQGLGAEGTEGIAAPIETNVYAAGVGLGHEGSKRGDAAEEAARATGGNGFLEMTRETARKRYEAMN